MDIYVSLVVAFATFHISSGDFSCICNYNPEIAVYNETSDSSSVLGRMYEFDCKAERSHTGMQGWASVYFEHQLGYVQLVDNMEQQSCPGSIPIGDALTTTAEAITTVLPTTTPPQPTTTAPPSTAVMTDQATTTTRTPAPTTTASTTAAPSTAIITDQATTETTTPVRTATTGPTSLSPVAGVHYGCEETLFLHAAAHESKLFTIGQTCYEHVRETKSWPDAENDCKSRGGHLVHIENDEQKNKLYQVVKQYHDDHVWIGLNDRDHEETFVWTSGEIALHAFAYPTLPKAVFLLTK